MRHAIDDWLARVVDGREEVSLSIVPHPCALTFKHCTIAAAELSLCAAGSVRLVATAHEQGFGPVDERRGVRLPVYDLEAALESVRGGRADS